VPGLCFFGAEIPGLLLTAEITSKLACEDIPVTIHGEQARQVNTNREVMLRAPTGNAISYLTAIVRVTTISQPLE
jgi:hypothetical protein